MLLDSLTTTAAAFHAGTGWEIKPEGACKGDVCIPLPGISADQIDVRALAKAMQMPIAEEPAESCYALGPEYIGGRALTSARAPDLTLPDLAGKPFTLSNLLGQKVIVYAWAPY